MIKAKKFGTFAGVYTPSILTILGVIMYMRLGWVVGQSGLLTALVIILLAHVISVSTGLSISSIATDKKIKTGGIYYILSRSLGLPMGGAIGISLFVGTALSISLYLIGFAESFLSIEAIRNLTGLESDINGYRIVGTSAILILVLVAFISTSLAIKTQFYILGAIVLSLISIGVGFFVHPELAPEVPNMLPPRNSLSPELVFAVFFPAVTGFTAGVAMSGDLKDSKKAIPLGTLASIGTGLVIYIGLAVAFAFFVDRDLLLNDYNFLLKIAWFSPLVIAGIWGATLSSALGGILGGPRILQAISSDRLLPKVFAKGYGKNNEPRNALILIFLIAQAGILIGELNVIAGLVTMFYLASYGFINLAFFLESWASTDFRPSFKVNRFIGLVGFIAAFGVMFKLDMMSMIAALIIITLIYLLLRRKEITNDFGDVWQSVYSSLVRTALHKMDKSDLEQRNWKPNIVLFSGGTKRRPHLLSFGKSIVGKHGVMSNFDLIEKEQAEVLFPKAKQSIPEEETDRGVFTRKMPVKNIYEGIETISSVYGFSGFEPNTVLMGWARQTKNPERFVKMINYLYDLDLNVLLLDYDKRTGFGKHKTIDIWWKDVSNQGNLALTLAKFMMQSSDWQNATVRLMIINTINDQKQNIFSRAEKLLDSMRIEASIRIINNQFEQKSFHDIILEESLQTDFVILGIPPIEKGKEADYVERTNKLLHKIGTVLMIQASSNFKEQSLGSESSKTTYLADTIGNKKIETAKNIDIELTEIQDLNIELQKLYNRIINIFDQFNNNYILPALKFNISKSVLLRQSFETAIAPLEAPKFWKAPHQERSLKLYSIKTGHITRSEKLLTDLQKTIQVEQKELLDQGLSYLLTELDKLPGLFPNSVKLQVYKNDLRASNADKALTSIRKSLIRAFKSNSQLERGVSYHLKLKESVKIKFSQEILHDIYSSLENMGDINTAYIIELQKLTQIVNDYFGTVEDPKTTIELAAEAKAMVDSYFDKLDKLIIKAQDDLVTDLLNEVSDNFNAIVRYTGTLNTPPKSSKTNNTKAIRKKLLGASENWKNNRSLLYNRAILELKLIVIRYRLQHLIRRSIAEIREFTADHIVKRQSRIYRQLSKFIKEYGDNPNLEIKLTEEDLNLAGKEELQMKLNKITDSAYKAAKLIVGRLPVNTEVISMDALRDSVNIMDEELQSINISTSQLVDFYVQQHLIEPLIRKTKVLPSQMQSSNNKIKDAVRLISMGSFDMGSINSGDTFSEQDTEQFTDKESFIAFAKDQLKIIQNEGKQMENTLNDFQNLLDNQLKLAAEDLTLYQLIGNPDKYKTYFMKREKVMGVFSFKTINRKLSQYWQSISANIWYSESRALIFARRMNQQNEKALSQTDLLLSFKDQIAPEDQILNKIPFYYRQLFLQKHNYQNEFWFNRTRELEEFRKAIGRYEKAYSGAILIRGDRKSGKTFFTNYLAKNILKDYSIYNIQAPSTGSVDPDVFHKALEAATLIKGSYNEIFGSFSSKTAVIIDDLELWWEKTAKGQEVTVVLKDLIRQYSNKCLFIINTNRVSYKVIDQLSEMDNSFLSIIDLEAFNSLSLKEAIMFRHRSSGMEIAWKNRPNAVVTNSKLARLFARYFKYSGGNIGVALLAWIANIEEVDSNKIFIKSPANPDLSIISSLSPDIKVYLSLMILHNRVTIDKLVRLTHDTNERVSENISVLKRAGLIKESTENVFDVDPYFLPFIKQALFNKDNN